MKKLFQSEWMSRTVDAFLPVFATLAALLVGAVMLLLLKVNPIEAYAALWDGAFGSPNAVAETLVKATPLLLVALGICISFRGNVINIGGEGQMVIGALLATWVGLTFTEAPGWLIIVLALVCGFLGGAVWGGIPGVLKAYFNVNEILSTVMIYILLWRTTLGYRIRAVGQNPNASRYAGINVPRYMVLALLLSGAFAGLAGAVQVYGVNYRMITDGSASGFTGSAGFNGIVAALFGQLHPLLSIPASILFGALLVGANKMQRMVQVPSALVIALNGLVVVFVVSSEIWRRYRQRRRLVAIRDEESPPELDQPEVQKEEAQQ